MKNRNFLVFNTNVLSRLMSELFQLEKPEKSAIFQLLWPPPWKKGLIRAIFDLRKKIFLESSFKLPTKNTLEV